MSALPKSLQEIIEILGENIAMELVKHLGGRHLYVPNAVSDDHDIAKAIGLEQATKFCQHFRGSALSIPKCKTYFNRKRNQEMIELHRKGEKIPSLVATFGLTTRQIRTILNSSIEE